MPWLEWRFAQALPKAAHAYSLNGTYADELGGLALVPQGGVLDRTKPNFKDGHGLILSNGLGSATYSIEMRVPPDISGFVIADRFPRQDVRHRAVLIYGSAYFYGAVNANKVTIAARKHVHCVADAERQQPEGGGLHQRKRQLAFVDTTNLAAPGAAEVDPSLLQDDTRTGWNFPGFVDYIRLYDVVLTVKDVADLARPAAAERAPAVRPVISRMPATRSAST